MYATGVSSNWYVALFVYITVLLFMLLVFLLTVMLLRSNWGRFCVLLTGTVPFLYDCVAISSNWYLPLFCVHCCIDIYAIGVSSNWYVALFVCT